jgi:hypothetical protein
MEKNQKDLKKDDKQTSQIKTDQQKSTILPKAAVAATDEKSGASKKDDKKHTITGSK